MSESLYETVLEECGKGVVVVQDEAVIYANDRLQELTGHDESDLVGEAPAALFANGESPLADAPSDGADVSDERTRHTVDLETEDGGRISVDLTVTEITYDGAEALAAWTRAIRDEARRERGLADLKHEYESVVENVQDALFLLDVDEDETVRYTRFNKREEAVTGMSTTEIRGKTPVDVFGEELGSELTANYEECLQRQEEIVYEEELDFGQGPVVWQTKLTPIIEDGEVERIVGAARDITELRRRERELQRARSRLRALLDGAPESIFIHNPRGEILDINEQAVENLGYDREELVGMEVTDIEVGWENAGASDEIQELGFDETLKIEGEHQRADGSTFPVEVWISKLQVHGETQLLAVARDITARKRREQRLRTATERLELAVEGAGIGVWDWDVKTDEVDFNDQWAEMLGYDLDEIGATLDAWEGRIHQDDLPDVRETLDSHLAGATDYYESEHRLETADGDWKWIRDIGKVVERDEFGSPVRAVGIHLDIDEQKRYERALEQAQAELRQIIDLVPDLIFAKNREGEYLLANETTAEAYGLTPEEVEGSRESDIIPSVEESEGFRQDDLEVIESGESKVIPEEELTTADGETRILQTTKIPYEVPDTGEDAVLGYGRDVTDLKEYQTQLEGQRDNLEVLNQVMRHDIRNNLQLVLAYTETLSDQVGAEGEEYVQQVLDAAHDAIDITTTARDVTRVMLQTDVDQRPIRLRPALESVVDDVRASYGHALVRLSDSVPDVEVRADEMLESVFRNLLTNAVEHNDKEVPEVDLTASRDGEMAQVRVADNGPGISDERKETVFEQGEMGLDSEGTGLGLYLVDTLVDRYDGTVRVEDNEPIGAVFVVELPIAEG